MGNSDNNYGKEGFRAGPNARMLTSERSSLGIAGTVVSALTAPLLIYLDLLENKCHWKYALQEMLGVNVSMPNSMESNDTCPYY